MIRRNNTVKQNWDLEELIEHFTVIPEEIRLLGNRHGGTRLGFAVLLKFFQYQGRFPKGKQEISKDVIQYIAKQVDISRDLFQEYDWDGRSIKYHRAQIRNHMGFRDCTLNDMEQVKSWLQANILPQELQIGVLPTKRGKHTLSKFRHEESRFSLRYGIIGFLVIIFVVSIYL